MISLAPRRRGSSSSQGQLASLTTSTRDSGRSPISIVSRASCGCSDQVGGVTGKIMLEPMAFSGEAEWKTGQRKDAETSGGKLPRRARSTLAFPLRSADIGGGRLAVD